MRVRASGCTGGNAGSAGMWVGALGCTGGDAGGAGMRVRALGWARLAMLLAPEVLACEGLGISVGTC
eukprot:359305-Chlamydomonas_euryale.AAC.3